MSFKIGESVRFTNRQGGGVVQELLSNGMVKMVDDLSFELVVHQTELQVDLSVFFNESKQINTNKDYIKKVRSDQKVIKSETLITDLHYKNTGEHASEHILEFQLQRFRTALNVAFEKGLKETVVIHGIGAGVLKSKIYEYLKTNRKIISFGDADPKKFGQGATILVLKTKL